VTVEKTVEAVWRIEAHRVIAALLRITRDLGAAEDLAQDALLAALEQWPRSGVPDNPGAWLTAIAKRRAVDALRRQITLERKVEQMARDDPGEHDPFADLELDLHVEDDTLRLMFAACHPVLGADARIALALKTLAGLSTEEIARAFLVPTATMAQRIVRAKRALADADVSFEIPTGEELTARLESVLEVVYLIFNEGYAATAGADWFRTELCDEAMRLGRVLAALVPDDPEPSGLVALMEIQASRLRARVGRDGAIVTLLDQDRGRWDRTLITHALTALRHAEQLGGGRGWYVLQAQIAACHARAGSAGDTDWTRIATLYGVLAKVSPSPVIELNRAVAVSMADGPAAGLIIADRLQQEPALRGYHLLPSVRADLLMKLGRGSEARAEFERAAAMTANERERDLLLGRAAACG
jgi:RNA polymerase sigma factor (sigma-70 family)